MKDSGLQEDGFLSSLPLDEATLPRITTKSTREEPESPRASISRVTSKSQDTPKSPHISTFLIYYIPVPSNKIQRTCRRQKQHFEILTSTPKKEDLVV